MSDPTPISTEVLPALPYEEWRPTRETLHRYLQIVGKLALAQGVRRNHWWHITLRNRPRGWSTVELGQARSGPLFTCEFDFFDHVLRIDTDHGGQALVPLADQSVASFYTQTQEALRMLDIDPRLANPHPYDLPDKARPFAEDTEHDTYVPEHAHLAFRVFSQVGRILEEFSAAFSGKTSPVQIFWHSFDIATQRYSPRQIPAPEGMDEATRESYSREQISSGFWYGDPNTPEPTFYSYTYPEPEGIESHTLRPDKALWTSARGSHTANYSYDDARSHDDPVGCALEFFQSAYEAGSSLAGWDSASLACWNGITDPLLRSEEPLGGRRWPERP
ncbi:DUF5996 family protein [Catenulispora subtropica]|uniref:DUF5996 family protein n=1 Tax=Catenulispora subtropica TaxID=450798 RepID=A0ABP5EGX8_9ACTN